jgi:hypothetical protein
VWKAEMLKYKLTDQDNMTYNNTLWGEGVTHETDGSGELCSPGWLHFYHSAELAVMLNPAHADIKDPKLWECEAEGQFLDDHGLKGGCTRLTTIREIPLPEITLERRIRFGILCAQKVFGGRNEVWDKWSEDWLSGRDRRDRSLESARAAAYAARDAAEYAAYAAEYAAYAYAATRAAAYAARDAAEYAAYAAEYAAKYDAADAANAAARYAADATRDATARAARDAAARAAAHAARAAEFDLQALLLQVIQEEN